MTPSKAALEAAERIFDTEGVGYTTRNREALKAKRIEVLAAIIQSAIDAEHAEVKTLRDALADIVTRAQRIRERDAVVTVEAKYIEQIAKAALTTERKKRK